MAQIKQVNVTFDFDPETEAVSGIKCFIDGVEKKTSKPTSKKKIEKVKELETEALVTLEDNKLVLNNKAVDDLGLEYKSRVIVKYEKQKSEARPQPTIGSDISFSQEGVGNQLTKAQTVSFRGKPNTILLEYGTKFRLEAYKEGVFRLISLDAPEINPEEAIKEMQKMELESVTVVTEDDENITLSEMTFSL